MRTDKYEKRTNWSKHDHRTIFDNKNLQMPYIQTSPIERSVLFSFFFIFSVIVLLFVWIFFFSFLILDIFAKWTECVWLCLVFMCTCYSWSFFSVVFLFVRISLSFKLKFALFILKTVCTCKYECVFGLSECLNIRIKNVECFDVCQLFSRHFINCACTWSKYWKCFESMVLFVRQTISISKVDRRTKRIQKQQRHHKEAKKKKKQTIKSTSAELFIRVETMAIFCIANVLTWILKKNLHLFLCKCACVYECLEYKCHSHMNRRSSNVLLCCSVLGCTVLCNAVYYKQNWLALNDGWKHMLITICLFFRPSPFYLSLLAMHTTTQCYV